MQGDLLFIDPAEVAAVVEEARSDVRYVVTDFPVESIVAKFKDEAEQEGDIYIPPYQRSLAWTDEQGSYLVESLLLKVPVPPIFLYDVRGRLEIVDGSQRIRSLVRFFNNQFRLSGLEKIDVLNGFYYRDLPLEVQRRLSNTPLRSFVIEETTDASMRVELFRRLNTSGKRLQDAEIRKGAFRGPFLDLVIECSETALFKELTKDLGGKVDPKSERQELLTRFFIYSECYEEFRHDVRKFLDAKMVAFNKSFDEAKIEQLRAEFFRSMNFIQAHYPKAFYRNERSKRVPRVRFEAVAVGTNLALRINPNLQVHRLDWLETDEFKEIVRTDASNSGPKLRSRVEYVCVSLLEQADAG
jgi:hypothetical protein